MKTNLEKEDLLTIIVVVLLIMAILLPDDQIARIAFIFAALDALLHLINTLEDEHAN